MHAAIPRRPLEHLARKQQDSPPPSFLAASRFPSTLLILSPHQINQHVKPHTWYSYSAIETTEPFLQHIRAHQPLSLDLLTWTVAPSGRRPTSSLLRSAPARTFGGHGRVSAGFGSLVDRADTHSDAVDGIDRNELSSSRRFSSRQECVVGQVFLPKRHAYRQRVSIDRRRSLW